MSGLELPGFVVGLNGVIPLVEKSFQLWQALAETRCFGSEMMRVIAQLSMEYYRFLAWARVSGVMANQTAVDVGKEMTTGVVSNFSAFQDDLSRQLEAPIEKAAARIVSILEETIAIAQKYVVKNNARTQSSMTDELPSLAQGLSTTLPILGTRQNPEVASSRLRHDELAKKLQKKTPFRLRFTFTSKPWGTPDREALEKNIQEISKWNDMLEKMLPHQVRQSLFHEALPSHVLVDENKSILDTLLKAAEHQNEAVRAHARLWKERMDFESRGRTSQDSWEIYRRDSSCVVQTQGFAVNQSPLALATFREASNPPIQAVVERYRFGDLRWSFDDVKIATARLGEIVHLCSIEWKPSSLRTLMSICFVESADSISIVSRLPDGASPTRLPVSLYAILAKEREAVRSFQPPSLEQRQQLAQQVASAVYSLGLVRWFHKDVNCQNIVFFRDTSPSAEIMFGSPFLIGFSISRPEGAHEKSLNKDLESRSIYLHPDLRVAIPENRPPYHRKYEIYSLGLLLFEIGIWNTIDRAVKSTLRPQEFKERIVERCSRDLSFFMGTKFANVVLRCLSCADEDSPESESSLDSLYWSVVLELAKCR